MLLLSLSEKTQMYTGSPGEEGRKALFATQNTCCFVTLLCCAQGLFTLYIATVEQVQLEHTQHIQKQLYTMA